MISVLLVDDDPALLEIARLNLIKNKMMVIDTAQSAAEALEKLKTGTYDVIVSDYDMPGMTGIELLTKLRSSEDLIPFIIFTGKGQEQVAMEAINNGADFYLIRAGDPKNEFIYLTHKIQKAVAQIRADITIKESEERLRKLLHSLPSGVIVIDADTHDILQANPAALHMMGAKGHDIIGKSCFGLICPIEEGQCPVTDLRQKSDSTERVLLRKDGTAIPVITNIVKSTFGDRKVLVESFIDLTGLKKVGRELFVSNEKYRHLFEKSNEGIVVAQDGMLRLVNPRMVELTGYSEQELLSRPFSVFIHPDDRAMVMERYSKRLKGEEVLAYYSFRLILKDGSTLWIDISVSAIDWDGRPATLNFLTDITERKQAEHRQNLAAEIMGILNDPTALADSIDLILAAIKREAGFDAVGIRMRSGDDFPYIVQNGFSCDFLRTENFLIARDPGGYPLRDENGKPLLECTCGMVISGKTDPDNPLFTRGGSCWTNNSLALLDLTTEQDPRFQPRNTCIHQGFMSIAFIPIHANREIIGLLQLNNRKKDSFTLEIIHFFEGIGSSIGIALTRKQAVEELVQLTDRLSLATRTGGVGIWDLDLITNKLTWDDQMFALYGITREQFNGAYETWQAGVHPDDRVRGDAEVQMALRGEKEFDTEFRVLWPDGRVRNIRALARVQRDTAGKPVRMIGTNWDITQQKTVERELQESKEKYRTLVEEIHDMIWLIDARGQFKYVSPRCFTLLGYLPEEMTGHLFSEFTSFEDATRINDIFGNTPPEQKGQHLIETHTRRKDGSIIILASSAVPYYAKNGNILGYRGVSRDVTVIKEALEIKSRLAAIVNSSDDAIVGEDLHHRITSWNDGAERMYGYSRDEMIGTDSYRIVPDVEKGVLFDIMAQVLKGEHVEHVNTFRIKKDGSRLEISLSLSPIKDEQGNIIGIAKIARDLTKQREAEKALLDYISETAMRLKVPVELIGGRLSDIQEQVLAGNVVPDELNLQLQIQIKNTEQIVSNLRDLNIAISTGIPTIPEAYRNYLKK